MFTGGEYTITVRAHDARGHRAEESMDGFVKNGDSCRGPPDPLGVASLSDRPSHLTRCDDSQLEKASRDEDEEVNGIAQRH